MSSNNFFKRGSISFLKLYENQMQKLLNWSLFISTSLCLLLVDSAFSWGLSHLWTWKKSKYQHELNFSKNLSEQHQSRLFQLQLLLFIAFVWKFETCNTILYAHSVKVLFEILKNSKVQQLYAHVSVYYIGKSVLVETRRSKSVHSGFLSQ